MMVRLLKGRDGVAYVYTVEGYRDENGRVKQRILVKHGRLDVLEADDPDALAKLKAEARQANSGVIWGVMVCVDTDQLGRSEHVYEYEQSGWFPEVFCPVQG